MPVDIGVTLEKQSVHFFSNGPSQDMKSAHTLEKHSLERVGKNRHKTTFRAEERMEDGLFACAAAPGSGSGVFVEAASFQDLHLKIYGLQSSTEKAGT